MRALNESWQPLIELTLVGRPIDWIGWPPLQVAASFVVWRQGAQVSQSKLINDLLVNFSVIISRWLAVGAGI